MASIWRIEMLGGLRVVGRERTITRFRTQKTACLLAYLAYHLNREHPREVLFETLWPESDPELSRQSLRKALSSLRHQLEPPGIPEGGVLLANRFSAHLNPQAVTTDVGVFQDLVRQAKRADTVPQRREALEQALNLYRGELLPGFYESWVVREQDLLLQVYTDAVCELVDLLAASGDQAEALSVLQRARSLYPTSPVLQALGKKFGSGVRVPVEKAPETGAEEASEPARRPETQSTASQHADAPDVSASSLPPTFTRFFGREREMEELRRLLSIGERLVTLTGPGGTGKTRLALETARGLEAEDDAPVWFVPLSGLSDPAQVPAAIRSAMALPALSDTDALEQVAFVLANRPALLLLDNFEHLVDGGAEVVQKLLLCIPTLSLLVTSRRQLNLSAERAFPVPPLPVPQDLSEPGKLLDCRSVQLFVDRAQAVRPDFQVTAHNAEALACLCVRLEGLPLALELAAARSALIPPSRMLEELSHRFDLLVSRKRDADPRHQTLKGAIDWSYDLLALELRAIFRQLSVFRGGWTEEGAAFVCGVPDILPCLEELAESSLILVEETEQGFRFRMLETLREYGWEQMREDEQWALRKRHRDYILRFAEEAGPKSRGRQYREWFSRIEAEHENVRAALAFCQEDPDGAEAAMFIVAAMSWCWAHSGRREEGFTLLRSAQTHPGLKSGTTGWAMSMVTWVTLTSGVMGNFAWSVGDAEQAVSVLRRARHAWALVVALVYLAARYITNDQPVPGSLDREALALAQDNDLTALVPWVLCTVSDDEDASDALEYARQTDNREEQVNALIVLARQTGADGDVDRAWAIFGEAETLCREINDPGSKITLNRAIGEFCVDLGEYAQAQSYRREAEAISRSVGDLQQLSFSLWILGNGACEEGDYVTARRYYEEQKALIEQHGYPENAYLLHSLGRLTAIEGDVETGRALLLRALALNRARGARRWEFDNLLVLGNIARRQGKLAEARRLLIDGLGIWTGTRHPDISVGALEALACLAVAEGRPGQAARLYGAAEALRRVTPRKLIGPEDLPEHEAAIATARAALGEDAFASAWAEGRAMSLDEAIDYALDSPADKLAEP